MQTKSKSVEMDNGIIVTITVVDDGINTTATTSVQNMNIITGSQLSHVGGRPNDRG